MNDLLVMNDIYVTNNEIHGNAICHINKGYANVYGRSFLKYSSTSALHDQNDAKVSISKFKNFSKRYFLEHILEISLIKNSY